MGNSPYTHQIKGAGSLGIAPRVGTAADAAAITPNCDSSDIVKQVNAQVAGTLTINAVSGTPSDGQKLELWVKSANVQTFSWNAAYQSLSAVLPTATVANKWTKVGLRYNLTDTKWDCDAVGQQP
jgi:hypothetical protein